MSMVFPGMDPYLEHPQLWPGVHSRLVVYLSDQLEPLLRPRYIAAVEERVFVEGPDRQIAPDVWLRRSATPTRGHNVRVTDADEPMVVQVPDMEVHETYIEILDRHSGQNVVTVIEVVSPANKFAGPGRETYLTKQHEVRRSTVHLVEIDLLRAGQHVLAVPEWAARGRGPYDYLACVNRAAGLRDKFDLYARRLRERLPRASIPLADDDPDVPLDLQAAVSQVYEAGRYRDRIDYRSPCQPPLEEDDQAWAHELSRAAAREEGTA
jgi:hypothetical protein